VLEGDTLQSVAYSELGKAAYWRSIAELNGIDDPMRVPPGRVLLIPTVADATRST
jgi:nucleoid-associated protein YgaU